ncbi:LacI family DNA-binding transcriptional regulator [Microbacterium sp. BWT-B31]|uniref:LacI family DNA-binding transcriptional regulator n=1 Tax=Microbacterium sp. BWT-B31 TaxID=3232072 RepID=UPI003528B175
MSGIAEVARRAGVSKSTASRALTGAGYVSDETRRRVQQAAADLGYRPSTSAVGLATGRTRSIGVLLPYVNRWFFAEALEGVQEALHERGLDLTLYAARPDTATRRHVFRQFLTRKGFDGLIAIGLEPQDGEVERLLAMRIPVVGVVGTSDAISVVAIDDEHASRRATELLVDLGHRDIVFLGGGASAAHVDRLRMSGYSASMTDAALTGHIRFVPSDVTLPGGYAAAVDLLGDARRRPTAIVAVCDEVAIGAIIAARRLGIRVPSELSVVGIDDHEYAAMFSLTTLRQVPREQGAAAVELLQRHLHDREMAPTAVRLQATLVMRSSTAPPLSAESTVQIDMRERPAWSQ